MFSGGKIVDARNRSFIFPQPNRIKARSDKKESIKGCLCKKNEQLRRKTLRRSVVPNTVNQYQRLLPD